jgi:hypothetical protein
MFAFRVEVDGVSVSLKIIFGLVAQWLEQLPFKQLVLGSSPSQPTIFPRFQTN